MGFILDPFIETLVVVHMVTTQMSHRLANGHYHLEDGAYLYLFVLPYVTSHDFGTIEVHAGFADLRVRDGEGYMTKPEHGREMVVHWKTFRAVI